MIKWGSNYSDKRDWPRSIYEWFWFNPKEGVVLVFISHHILTQFFIFVCAARGLFAMDFFASHTKSLLNNYKFIEINNAEIIKTQSYTEQMF